MYFYFKKWNEFLNYRLNQLWKHIKQVNIKYKPYLTERINLKILLFKAD